MVSQVPLHTNTHVSSLTLPPETKCPSTTFVLAAVRLQTHADIVPIAGNSCTAQVMNFGDFFFWLALSLHLGLAEI